MGGGWRGWAVLGGEVSLPRFEEPEGVEGVEGMRMVQRLKEFLARATTVERGLRGWGSGGLF